VIPLAPGIARAIDLALGERCDGPIFLTPAGERLDRHGAGRIVRRVTRGAGLAKKIYPHRLRHAFITVALDAGVPLRDVQEAASRADPRSTRSRPRLALPARYLHRRRLHCPSRPVASRLFSAPPSKRCSPDLLPAAYDQRALRRRPVSAN
jgi:integrase